jgi:DNA helicase-2/ATP-dependent DNA helicase PcrA
LSAAPIDIELQSVSTEVVDASDAVSEPLKVVAAAAITTAATLSQTGAAELPRVSPDAFRQGQCVLHPEYGPGKIVALSGLGQNRRATIQFATVGEKKIVLAHSRVRPGR